MSAVKNNSNPKIIELLLAKNADPIARDNNGKRVVDYLEENRSLRGSDVYWELHKLEPEKREIETIELKSKFQTALMSTVIPSAGHAYTERWWPKGALFLLGEGAVIGAALNDSDNRSSYLSVFAILKLFEVIDSLNEAEKLNNELIEYNQRAEEFNQKFIE